MRRILVVYADSSTAFANRLAAELNDRGIGTWQYHRDVRVGDSVLGRINEILSEITALIILFGEGDTGDPYFRTQWLPALARQLEGKNVTVLPALLPGGQIPAILADRAYADFTRSWIGATRRILQTLEQCDTC